MKSNQQNVFNANSIFDSGFLDGKALYLYCFSAIPSANFITGIDGEKAFNAVRQKFAKQIKSVHTYRFFDRQSKKYDFNQTYMLMNNNCILEFDTGYCEIFHDGLQDDFIKQCTDMMKAFKSRQRRKPLEINLIMRERNNLYLRGMEIKRTKLDIGLYYEDDFKEVDAVICKRLNQKKDKGIVLLHGLPGTGKTTYLRHLVGRIKKKVLFLSPAVATNLMDPELIELLINNPNCVLVIEDAENVIMDRKISSNASVSNPEYFRRVIGRLFKCADHLYVQQFTHVG